MSRRNLIRSSATAALLAAAVVAWLAFAPTQLGGSATYAVVYGTSMLPHFHADDLVIVRKAGSYRAGDVVLYENRELHRPVLHRIVAVRGDRFVIKGDNNDFLDRPHARPGDIRGRLWLHIPGGGRWLRWLRVPTHAAALAALVALLLLVGGGGTGAVRRRERAARPPRRSLPPASLPPERSLLAGLVAAGVVALAAIGLAFLAFRAPPRHAVPVPRLYGQSVRLAYDASVPRGPAYPDGRIGTGDAIFLKVAERVRLVLSYRFTAAAAHALAGRGILTATLSDGAGWSRSLDLAPRSAFSGDTATLDGTLDLPRLSALLRGVIAETGTDAGAYTLAVRPQVDVHGVVDGKPFRDSLSGAFAFRLDPIRLAPVGGTGGQDPSFRLARWTPGLRDAPNDLRLLGVTLDVRRARFVAPVLLALAGLGLVLAGLLLLRVHRADEESRIRARFGSWLVEVAERPERAPETVVRVDSFESLVRLAERYDRMILDEGGRYTVEDGSTAYVYDVLPELVPAPPGGEQGDYGWADDAVPADGWT